MNILEELFSGAFHQDWHLDFGGDADAALSFVISGAEHEWRERAVQALEQLLADGPIDDEVVWQFHGNLKPTTRDYTPEAWLRHVIALIRAEGRRQPIERVELELDGSIRSGGTLDDQLRRVVAYKERGVEQEAVYWALERIRRAAPNEALEDRALEVMDYVWGYCPASQRIWPAELTDNRVADYFADKLVDNLDRIRRNLEAIGYRFAVEEPIRYVDRSNPSDVDWFESSVAKLPVVASAVYRRVTEIDFSQDVEHSAAVVADLGAYGVPLLYSLREQGTHIDAIQAECEGMLGYEHAGDATLFLPLGGAASNCDPIGLMLPSTALDPVVRNDGVEATFTEHWRRMVADGGFRFWRYVKTRGLRGFEGPDLDVVFPAVREGLVTF